MKDQYVGDINDYRKYGLIDKIAKVFGSNILFVWMLTGNDSTDGNKTTYLNKPQKYRQYNPELFDELVKIVEKKKKDKNIKNILAIQNSKLLKNYSFFTEILEDDASSRRKYFDDVYKISKKHDLIFLDPDNGIEIPSCKYGTKKSSKYIYWNEIEYIFNNLNKDILIYQHFPRKDRNQFINEITKECKAKLKNGKIIPIKTSNTLFLLIIKKTERLLDKLKAELDIWKGEIDFV